MKTWLPFIVFFFAPVIQVYCQSVIDLSLEDLDKELSVWDEIDTIRRIEVLNELAYRFQENSLKREEVRNWANEALDLSLQKNYLIGEGDAFMRLGVVEELDGEIEKAIKCYNRSLVIRRDSLQNPRSAASVCNNIGLALKDHKDSLQAAISYYLEGLRLVTLAPVGRSRASLTGKIMNNLGECYTKTGLYKKAQIFLDSSLLIRSGINDTLGMAYTYLNIGLLFSKMGVHNQSKINLDTSLTFFQKQNSLKGTTKSLLALGNHYNILKEYQKSIEYYDLALRNSSEIDAAEMANIYQDRAIAYEKLKQFRLADDNYQKALVIFQEVKDHDALALLYNNLGGLLKAQEKYKQAIDNYKQGLSYTGLSADVNTKANLYFNLSETYAAVGVADSAILYSTKYTLYNDTIADAYRDAMNARYNLAIAENEIQRLNLEQIEEKRKRMEFYGSVAFGVSWLLLGLAVMGYYLNRQRRRLVEQQSILSQQRVLELVREKELETNYALMQGVETTRKKIGRELHDSIGSMLSIAKVYFTSFNEKVSNIQEENRQQYQKANDLLDDACEKVRQISHEMTSAILVQFGLKTQLEALADTLRGTGFLQVELSTYGLTKRLDTQTEINIYRIIQELTSNVIKHAQAKKISIQVNRFDEMINVMVEDNGVGFDVEGAKTSGDGIGLKNVAARVHGLEGTIRYDSSPGKGTSVTVDIPISDDPPLSIDNS